MKKLKILMLAIAAVIAQSVSLQTLNAQELYRAYFTATKVTTNGPGGLGREYIDNRRLIRECAMQAGVTNLAGLSLVYNRTLDALQVVSGTNHTVICTPLFFFTDLASGTFAISNTNGTRIERSARVANSGGNLSTLNGTMVASERLGFSSSNTISYFNLHGQLSFWGFDLVSGRAIYSGVLIAGSFFPYGDWRWDGPGSWEAAQPLDEGPPLGRR